MFWDHLLKSWQISLPMVRSRFPHADEHSLDALQLGYHNLASLMAQTHDLTPREAVEEVEDWLHILHISEFDRSTAA